MPSYVLQNDNIRTSINLGQSKSYPKNYLNVEGYLKVAERLFEMLIKTFSKPKKDCLNSVPKR